MKASAARERESEIQRVLEILHKWGIHTLGQLTALDKEQLGLRLGPIALQLWERAHGNATRLLKFVAPPESFEESFEFEQEVELIEPLLFVLRRFLEQLALRLRALYLVAQDLELRIGFSDKTSYRHRFRIPQATADVEVLFRMLHTHLEQFKSEHPIVGVSLRAQPTKPGQQQFGLFETALRDPNRLSETLARLTGLLGADRVGTPVLEETHRPDAFRIEPFTWRLSEGAERTPSLPAYALRRFRPATIASVMLAKDKPAHVRSREIDDAVVEQKGPYPASGNWWDESAWTQTEWDVQLANGTLCRCHEHERGWAIDGIYD